MNIFEAAYVLPADQEFIKKHMEKCGHCKLCQTCRVRNCSTLDAIVEMFVEERFCRKYDPTERVEFDEAEEKFKRMVEGK